MLRVSEQRLRSWERQGLVPAATVFSFADLIALRTIQKLRENRIPSRQIGRALESLRKKLADVKHPLSELKIVSNGRTIAVQVAGQKMEAISGQMLFDFDAAELGSLKSFPAPPPAQAVSRVKEAEMWFQQGVNFEETGASIERAIEAYQKAAELNPHAAGALVNLGTIYYRLGQFPQAQQYYQQAIAADRNYALAFFNQGNLHDEEGDLEKAQEFYVHALQLDSGYADAHFNLALLCEKKGDVMKAVHHWKAYLKLDGSSSWAEIARRQLEKLREAAVIRSR